MSTIIYSDSKNYIVNINRLLLDRLKVFELMTALNILILLILLNIVIF